MAWGIVSRWPVVILATIEPVDCEDGALARPGLERLFGDARRAYFERCATFDGAEATVELVGEHQSGVCVPGDRVDVATGATEVFAERIHMSMRIRGSSDLTVDTTWSVAFGAVTPAVRDELIGLAHGAAHVL